MIIVKILQFLEYQQVLFCGICISDWSSQDSFRNTGDVSCLSCSPVCTVDLSSLSSLSCLTSLESVVFIFRGSCQMSPKGTCLKSLNFMTVVVPFQLIFLKKIQYIAFRDLSPSRPFQELKFSMIVFVTKLEVIHKQVGVCMMFVWSYKTSNFLVQVGYLPSCARIATSIALNC